MTEEDYQEYNRLAGQFNVFLVELQNMGMDYRETTRDENWKPTADYTDIVNRAFNWAVEEELVGLGYDGRVRMSMTACWLVMELYSEDEDKGHSLLTVLNLMVSHNWTGP